MFGTFVKQLRTRHRLGLRQFCLLFNQDPSNWSKIEREVLAPPADERIIRKWAQQLGLKEGTDDWLTFFEYAAVDACRIPDHIASDQGLLKLLPPFFRTLSGHKPSREDLDRLLRVRARRI